MSLGVFRLHDRIRNMNLWRTLACAVLLLAVSVSLAANWLAPAGYAKQYREATDAPPSRLHWLGTDEIGRDRFARVLYGTRISLLLAPAAALLSTLMAALVGGLAGYLGGAWARAAISRSVGRAWAAWGVAAWIWCLFFCFFMFLLSAKA